MADNTQDMQNSSLQKVNTFVKGMIKDLTDVFIPEGVWTNAINAINNSHLGDEGSIGNEQANKFCTSAPYTIIGILHKYKTEWVVFSTNDTDSEIGIFDEANCSYTKLVNDPCLNFNKKYIITGAVKYNADCTYQAYWQDNNNPDRTMNLDNIPYKELKSNDPDECNVPFITDELDCDKLRLAAFVQQPCVKVSKAKGAGQLNNGSYQAVIAYSHNGIRLTDYSIPSQPVGLWDHSGIGGSLDINITNLDTNYEEYELVVIAVINQQTIAKKIGNYDVSQSSVHLDLFLQSLETIPLSLIPLRSVIYEKSKKMFTVNNYLIRTSVTTQPYFNYQPLANQIKVEWVAVEYEKDYYWKGGVNTGYMRDEVYPFFIRWVYNTGARSASFHIPGRASTILDTNIISNIDTENLSKPLWQVYDTSTISTGTLTNLPDGGVVKYKGKMAYWESTERYPDGKPEVWGDLCNQPIRHHKMPSNETIHIHDTTGEYIYVLGVQFYNIKHPVDGKGNPITEIVGYEILRGSREGNRSIIAKGMFNNMLEFDIKGLPSVKGLMQNYPYNDIRPNDPFLKDVTPKKDFFSFHSPEVSFVKPYIGSGIYTKIYTEEIGTMKGTFEIPYKHPQFKVITDTAFTFAATVGVGIALVSAAGKTTTTSGSHAHTAAYTNVWTTSPFFTNGSGTLMGSSVLTTKNGELDFDTIATLTTEGGTATAVTGLANQVVNAGTAVFNTTSAFGTLKQLAEIANLILTIADLSFYAYEAAQTVLDIIRKLIPFKDYVLQYNSHAFYNTYRSIVNNSATSIGVKPSIIRLSNGKYISSGVQDFNSTKRINNLHRNRYIALNIPNELPNPFTVDKTKKTGSQAGGINDEVTEITSAYYGAIKLPYDNQYGQLQSVVQLPTDSCVLTSTASVTSVTSTPFPVFGGDVYINRYTEKNPYMFFNTWLFGEPNGTSFNYRNYVNGPQPKYYGNFNDFNVDDFDINLSITSLGVTTPSDWHNFDAVGSNGVLHVKNRYMYLFNNGVRDFFTESELNMAYRDYGDNDYEKFYDVYGDSFNNLQTMFRSDLITKPIYYKYDLSLSTSKLFNNFASWGTILPSDYDPKLYETCYEYYPYRGIYSLQQQDGLKRDNWRNFLPLNYYTFDGIVTSIKSLNANGAVVLFEDASPSQFVGIDKLVTDAGTKITIGDGGLFANNVQAITNAEDALEYGSTISHRSVLNTPYGLFYISQKAGKIINYGGNGLEEISKSGMKHWFLENLPSNLLEAFPNFREYDNPVAGIGCQAIYDAQYELVYFTKKDYKPLTDCIKYDPDFGFYDICKCIQDCPAGYTFNALLNKCEKVEDTPMCAPGSYYDPISKTCITETNLCPPGYNYDPALETCVQGSNDCLVDLVIVMDNSGSLSPVEMQQQNAFVKSIFTELTPSLLSDKVRIGLVKFGSCGQVLQYFTNNITTLNSIVDTVNRVSAATNQSQGLDRAIDIFEGAGARPSANKNIILITDGYRNSNNLSCNPPLTHWTDTSANGSPYEEIGQALLDFGNYIKNSLNIKITLVVLGTTCERDPVLYRMGGKTTIDPPTIDPACSIPEYIPDYPSTPYTVNYPLSSPGFGLYGYATYQAEFDNISSILSELVTEVTCYTTTEPKPCDLPCVISSQGKCVCISEPYFCEAPSEIIKLSNNNYVCRTYLFTDKECATVPTCDVANGFSFNSETGLCEKIEEVVRACPEGMTYAGGMCYALTDDYVTMCPEGYTYNGVACEKITTQEPDAVTDNKYIADIVIVNDKASTAYSKTFFKGFFEHFQTDIAAGNIRVAITNSTDNAGTPYPPVNAQLHFGAFELNTIINNYSSWGAVGSESSIDHELGLQKAEYIFNNAAAHRTTVPRIVIYASAIGPKASDPTRVYNTPCPNGSNSGIPLFTASPLNTYAVPMKRALWMRNCLTTNDTLYKVFVVNYDPVDHTGFGNQEGNYYFNLKTNGIVYEISDNATALTELDNFISTIEALTLQSTTTYTCPSGTTFNSATGLCEIYNSEPATICTAPCTPKLIEGVWYCYCSEEVSIPYQCNGDCEVTEEGMCSCLVTQTPEYLPIRFPISLDDPAYFEKVNWTISYDPKIKAWISFHDWHPNLMIPSNNHFFTIDDKAFWKHNERVDSFVNYYNRKYPWEVEYPLVTVNTITTLRSLEYYMEAYKYYNDGKDYFHVLDENFDRAYIYNSEQVSPLLSLKIKDKNNPLEFTAYPIVTPNFTTILVSKEENKYRFNGFYDATKDRGEFSGVTTQMFITSADGYHKTINPAYINILKTPTERKKFRHYGNRIVLRKNISGDKKMILKLTNSKHLNSPR